jgi:hypothetical protein
MCERFATSRKKVGANLTAAAENYTLPPHKVAWPESALIVNSLG